MRKKTEPTPAVDEVEVVEKPKTRKKKVSKKEQAEKKGRYWGFVLLLLTILISLIVQWL